MDNVTAANRCYDCSAPCSDVVCSACLRLAAEAEYAEKYCRDEHGGPSRCSCAEEAAMAYEARRVSPLVEAVRMYAEGA